MSDNKKPKGRMSAYAYFVKTCREEHKKKHPNQSVNFAEFSKKCSDRWKTMDSEKKRFKDLADKDKVRYDREMAKWVPPKGETKGKKRKRKDPNAPKRNLSAFFLFCHDERGKVKANHPEWPVGTIAKELGEKWKKVSDSDKAKYNKDAQKEKARYEKDMAAYKAKLNKGPGKQQQKQQRQQQQQAAADSESEEASDESEEEGSDEEESD